MTTLQIILLCLTIPSALYQFLKIGQVNALVNHYGRVKITWGLRLTIVLTLAIEVAFILAMTGRIS